MRKHKPIPELTDKQIRNFWSKVKKMKKHWLWIGSKDRKGYGKVGFNDSPFLVSRVMYFLYFGIDPGFLCVLHRCDTPSCCNPKHLFLGTIADNNKDMCNKMRHQYGENHPNTNLTERNILAIRRSNKTTIELSKQYSVTRHEIGLIKRGKRWKHVSGFVKKYLRQKLFEKDIIAIKQSIKTQRELAEEYGVDITTISKIQLGHLQNHIAPELTRQRDIVRYPSNILTGRQVQKIKATLKDYYFGLGAKLAKKYGVSQSTISHIKTGRLWGHIHA